MWEAFWAVEAASVKSKTLGHKRGERRPPKLEPVRGMGSGMRWERG